MGAHRRQLVDVASLVAVDRDLASTATDDGSFTGLDRRNVASTTACEPILVLFRNVDVFFLDLRGRAEPDAGRIVESSPLMLASLHQLVEDDACNRAVGHPISLIAGGDPDVLIAARILADVR